MSLGGILLALFKHVQGVSKNLVSMYSTWGCKTRGGQDGAQDGGLDVGSVVERTQVHMAIGHGDIGGYVEVAEGGSESVLITRWNDALG